MTEEEIGKLVRDIAYRNQIEDSISILYKLINKKALKRKVVKKQKFEKETCHLGVMKDSKYRDDSGEKIWFPKDERPYHDKGLNRTFNTIGEKQKYMKQKGIVMDGSSMPSRLPVEAGDMRSRAYRKSMRLED